MKSIAIALLAATTSAAAEAPLPDLARAVLDAASETGEPAQVTAVANAAKSVFHDYAAAIDAYAAERIAELTPVEDTQLPEETKDRPKDQATGFFAVSPWNGKVAASAAIASGNSDNVAAGFALDAKRDAGEFTHNIDAYVDIARSEGAQTQQRWGGAYKLDYNFSKMTYAFGRIAFDEDAFSGFDYRLFAGVGLGHYFYKSEPFTWKVEAGPGYRYSPIDDSRLVDKNFAVFASSETDWLIREGVIFEQDFEATWTSPTTTFISTTALTTALTDSISTGVSFQVRYETDPPLGRENTDKVLRANLNYGF